MSLTCHFSYTFRNTQNLLCIVAINAWILQFRKAEHFAQEVCQEFGRKSRLQSEVGERMSWILTRVKQQYPSAS